MRRIVPFFAWYGTLELRVEQARSRAGCCLPLIHAGETPFPTILLIVHVKRAGSDILYLLEHVLDLCCDYLSFYFKIACAAEKTGLHIYNCQRFQVILLYFCMCYSLKT